MDPGHLEGGAILLVPERDVRVIDATEKVSGGVAGILVARLLAAFAGRLGWTNDRARKSRPAAALL